MLRDKNYNTYTYTNIIVRQTYLVLDLFKNINDVNHLFIFSEYYFSLRNIINFIVLQDKLLNYKATELALVVVSSCFNGKNPPICNEFSKLKNINPRK